MELEDFLLEDYKLKTEYLISHFSRVWTRFNLFLLIESALLGFSFREEYSTYVVAIGFAGMFLCLTWYYFSANDNYLSDHYRRQVQNAYDLLTRRIGFFQGHMSSAEEEKIFSDHTFVSDPDKKLISKCSFLRFRMKKLCASELAVLFPLMFMLAWSIRLVMK